MAKSPEKIKFRGATYILVTAQLQQLLAQFETDAKTLKGKAHDAASVIDKAVDNAHKAIMSGDMGQVAAGRKKLDELSGSLPNAFGKLSQELQNDLKELMGVADTIHGHLGMGGGN